MIAKEKLIKSRIRLGYDKPFFAYLLLNLNFIENKEIKTMGVDARGNLYYNPEFVDSLSIEELHFVLCHEILHCCFEHLIRIKQRDAELWNICADLVINDLLLSNGFTPFKDGLMPYNHSFTLQNIILNDLDKKMAETIYDGLYNKLPKMSISELSALMDGKGNGKRFDVHFISDGSLENMSEKEKDELKKLADKWKEKLVKASTYAKQRGNLPCGMERIIGELLTEKINWKALLYRYITNELPCDYSYLRPSRRSQATGFYMPSIIKENIEIVVAIDTSGSINRNELTEFLTEIVGISKSVNNLKMTALICDAEIQDVLTIENGNINILLETKIKGGGGTSHLPVYDWIQENKPTTKLLINFTDGFTEFPNNEITKTLWVICSGGCQNENIPFGEIVRLGD